MILADNTRDREKALAKLLPYQRKDFIGIFTAMEGLQTEAPTGMDRDLLLGIGEEAEGPKIPEIDSCCGHDMWTSIPFDSELRTCCSNGKVLQRVDKLA